MKKHHSIILQALVTLQIKVFSFASNFSDLTVVQPLLYIDVKLGEDDLKRIELYPGETAAAKAREFSR